MALVASTKAYNRPLYWAKEESLSQNDRYHLAGLGGPVVGRRGVFPNDISPTKARYPAVRPRAAGHLRWKYRYITS